MLQISSQAKLSRIYTNHCIRATSITCLSASGVDATDIIGLTGHKTIQSLIPYQRKVGDEKRRNMSKVLSSYGKPDTPVTSSSTAPTNVSTEAREPTKLVKERMNENEQVQMCSQSNAAYAQNLLKGVMEGNHFHAQQMYFTVSVNK